MLGPRGHDVLLENINTRNSQNSMAPGYTNFFSRKCSWFCTSKSYYEKFI